MAPPIVIATLQAAALSTASNVCAQFIEAHDEKRPFALDFAQLLRFVVLAFLSAPPNFLWQQLLERTFPAYPAASPRQQSKRKSEDIELGGSSIRAAEEGDADRQRREAQTGPPPKFSFRNTFTKWFVDCITLGALLNTFAFFIFMGILKGQSVSQILSNIRTETIPLIVASYKLWPIASIISFTFVPVDRRIVFLSFVGLVWGIYMSLVAARV